VHVDDPAVTVIQADYGHDFVAPADDYRSPPLEVERLHGNASQGAEAVHDPRGDSLGATNSRHGRQADHHRERSHLGIEYADQPIYVAPLANRDEALSEARWRGALRP